MIEILKPIVGVLQPILPWQPKAAFYSIHFSSQEKEIFHLNDILVIECH